MKEWFQKVRNKDARILGPFHSQKAEELAEKMGKVNFKATESASIGGKKCNEMKNKNKYAK